MVRTNAIKTLVQTPASALVRQTRPLIYVEATKTLDEALQLLRTNNILALPVFDPKTSKFIGLLHISDILNYVAFFNFTKEGQLSLTFQNGKQPVSALLGLSPEGTKIWTVDITDSVDDVLEAMSKGIHRMLIRVPNHHNLVPKPGSNEKEEAQIEDFSESELRLVTQSDFLRFFQSRLHDMEGLKLNLAKPIKDLKMISGTVVTMSDTEPAIQGFITMCKQNVSAIAIVDKEGKLVGNLSGSDLRGLTSNLIQRVLLPVLDFLKETNRGFVPPLISVTDQFTLKEIMHKITVCKVHRVWIEDGYNNKPIGVISISDILKRIYENE